MREELAMDKTKCCHCRGRNCWTHGGRNPFGNGFNIIVYEARARIGGRIHTVESNRSFAELGAEFIHGSKK